MRYSISHHSRNRVRLNLAKRRLTEQEADVLYYALVELEDVESVQVFPRTAQVCFRYRQKAKPVLDYIGKLNLADEELQELVPEISSRSTNQYYKEKIIEKCAMRIVKRAVLPLPIRMACTIWDATPFIIHGLKDVWKREFSAEIVHASAIGASLIIGDFSTASSIVFLTDLGEVLEEWTYKKSVDDLAQSLALNVNKVWKVEDGEPTLVSIRHIQEGDVIQVTMGNLIPLDGIVVSGDAMVNQAALTGEPLPVQKIPRNSVFAGTVVEEGELLIEVRQTSGQTKYDKIVRMIEESESMVSVQQSQAEAVVSKLIPYTFGTAVLTYLFTRNITKALSVLMVDFSCAIEVAMPIAVLSAMKEAGKHRVTVKGGRYLELLSEADTIVFDKTGTLTKATPVVADLVPMTGFEKEEMLRLAACLEEHFPHSLANAVVREAADQSLAHDPELHSKATYVVAHGIESSIGEDRVVIGSYHFIFEDEHAQVLPEDEHLLESISPEHSHLYMAIGGRLAAIIGIADPIKEDTREVIAALKATGIEHIVMMTGDSERTARYIAEKAGITEVYAEVLPEDKARYVEMEKAAGRKVIMIGDGINDSPALSAADVGVAIKEGADIAQQIADVTISGTDLMQLVTLRNMSQKLMKRMSNTAKIGISFNGAILIAGIAGLVVPGTAAFLHNASTITLCLNNMNDLVEEEPAYLELEEAL